MIATDHAAAFSKGGTCRARLEGLRLLPRRQQVLLAADWAEAVLPIWERSHPADGRPRRAVEAARAGDGEAAYAASSAAYASSSAYAFSAASFAAVSAAVSASFAASSAAYADVASASFANAAADVAYVAYAAVSASSANAAAWDGVRRLWDAAHHAGNVWRPEWRTPLAVELARDPAAYPVLLDLLADEGVPVEGLRAARWGLSNWAIYYLTEGKP